MAARQYANSSRVMVAAVLRFCARHGRYILAASLVVGVTSTTAANLVKPHIEIFIALLLFTACLRVGPHQVLGAMRDAKTSLVFTVVLQIIVPLSIAALAWMLNVHHPIVAILVILTAAPSISGSPNLVALMGFDPGPALRQLVIGTVLLPLTIIPVFILLPQIGDFKTIVFASLRLLAVISLAAAVAFTIRLTVLKSPTIDHLTQIDGASTILLAVLVFGLMAAIQTELVVNPKNVIITLITVCTINFGLQMSTTLALAKTSISQYAVPMGVVSGNRNFALFLTALPAATIEPILLFLACYQIPMYLTPIVMERFYKRF